MIWSVGLKLFTAGLLYEESNVSAPGAAKLPWPSQMAGPGENSHSSFPIDEPFAQISWHFHPTSFRFITTKRGIFCAIGRIRLCRICPPQKELSCLGRKEGLHWNGWISLLHFLIIRLESEFSTKKVFLGKLYCIEWIAVKGSWVEVVGKSQRVRDFIWWYVCFLAEDNQGIAWPVWRGTTSLKSLPRHWPPNCALPHKDIVPASGQFHDHQRLAHGSDQGHTFNLALGGWWSDALIQDNLTKLEFFGSAVAPSTILKS